MKRVLVYLVLFTSIKVGIAQKDYFNQSLQEKQWATIKRILYYVESNQPDSILLLIDTNFVKANSKLNIEIKQICRDVSKVYKNCLPPEGPINYIDGYNVYKCAYRDLPITYAQFEFYMKEGDPDSKVMKVFIKRKINSKKSKGNKKEGETPPKNDR